MNVEGIRQSQLILKSHGNNCYIHKAFHLPSVPLMGHQAHAPYPTPSPTGLQSQDAVVEDAHTIPVCAGTLVPTSGVLMATSKDGCTSNLTSKKEKGGRCGHHKEQAGENQSQRNERNSKGMLR